MSYECLDVALKQAVREMRRASSPHFADCDGASPKGWSQKWAHKLSTVANCSEISTSKARPSLLWAQGVAGLARRSFSEGGFESSRPDHFFQVHSGHMGNSAFRRHR
jgi:hypothetical protein